MIKELNFNLQFFAANSDPSRTEEATPKRKQEARRQGQVARSVDLNSTLVLLALFVMLNFFGRWLYNEIALYLRDCLSAPALTRELTETTLTEIFFQHLYFFGRIFLPLGLGALLMGLAINYFQVGVLFSIEPLKPKFSRINPLSGFKRMLGTQGLVELAKSLIKLTIVMYFAYSSIKSRLFALLDTVKQTPLEVAFTVWEIIYQVALKICIFLLILAAFDYAYQRWEFRRGLRMTKHEVKEEYKQIEGNPQIKSKIRQRQRQIASRRMMQDVPKSDVVITNPTHLAIALRYDSQTMSAPVVLAKGEALIAVKIKEIANANQIPLVENKPLAQALFKTVNIGEPVPAKLFQAVAEVLAFVYRLKRRQA